jgi:hypothetical protein
MRALSGPMHQACWPAGESVHGNADCPVMAGTPASAWVLLVQKYGRHSVLSIYCISHALAPAMRRRTP